MYRRAVITLNPVQRLFSMFPEGGPGLALLLLRISVAVIFLTNAFRGSWIISIPLLFAGVLLISISLGIGFLTPALSIVAATVCIVNLLIGPHSNSLILISAILNAAALGLLGPGAYSLDARLFGRRVIIVPPRKDTYR